MFVPDLPGFGQEPPPTKVWSLDDYAEWVRLYADQHGLDRFFLLGHSFGGRITVEFANRYSDRLRGIIFVASAGVTSRKKWRIAVWLVAAKIGNFIFSVPPFTLCKNFVRKIVYAVSQEKDYYRAQGVMRDIMKNVVRHDLTSHLRYISCPSLIIWGSDDKMTPIRDAHVFHDNIRGSKLVIFEGGKHGLNLQMPEKLAGTIVEWISRIES